MKKGVLAAAETGFDGDRALAIHPLAYFADRDEVTIGRPDIDSYAIFPPDGAELVRKLASGVTPNEAVRWYEAEYGESVSISHLLAALDELSFIRHAGEPPPEVATLRGQRLGQVAFCPLAWIGYGAIIAWAAVLIARSPTLLPDYHDLIFTKYYSIIEPVLLIGSMPLVLLHESFHVLAARRLNIGSRIGVSHRFIYIVMETALDGLVIVPRRKRVLPILAGMLSDTVVLGVLIVAADFCRGQGTSMTLGERLCLAFAFATALRVFWQFFFHLRTDFYALVTTMLGCVDLHTTAARMLSNRIKRLLGRRAQLADESNWHPVDRRAARWYSWLMLSGYLANVCVLAFAVAPLAIQMFSTELRRLAEGSSASPGDLLDAVIFIGFSVAQIAFACRLAVRARAQRRNSRLENVID
jgi:hypothetical protein